ncbi:hypothetical protein F5888DRAFT_822672 [Russula emetica]|nr:hypothetical protein F5888DRAFT_822672 [Russula emetica]
MYPLRIVQFSLVAPARENHYSIRPLNKSLTPSFKFISLSTLFLLTRSHLSMLTPLSVVLSLFALFLVQILLGLRSVARNVGNLPGPFYLFDLHSVPGQLIARLARPIPYLNPGTTWMLSKKYEEFAAAGRDAVSLITAFPKPKSNLYVADAEANKDVNHYAVLAGFGPNVVVSEGEEWKKYRKIVAPAFSERNNKLVWDETTRFMTDLFDNVWGDKSEIFVDHCVDITFPIALSVISAAGSLFPVPTVMVLSQPMLRVRPSDHMDD